MRVTTAFNRILRIRGAWVESVSFVSEGIVVGLRRRGLWRQCPCGTRTKSRYDLSRRRWRHLDMGAVGVWLEADVWRLDCRSCGRVRTEEVPWARPGARHSRDFEDVVAWLTQRSDKTTVARLLRCSWEAVDHITKRVVDEHLDDSRLNDLYHLGVDEISYRRGHQYLTVVADHDSGNVVWVAKGRTKGALGSFYEALGPTRRQQVRAVSMDMTSIYREATKEAAPQAVICLDPFHAMKVRHEALCYPVGCKDPPVVCRSRPLEAGGSLTLVMQGRAGSSPDKAGTDWYRQTVRVRQVRQKGATTSEPAVKPPQVWNQLKSGEYGLGRQRGAYLVDGNATSKPVVYAGGETMVKACGVAMERLSGEKLGIDPVNGYIVNVGTVPGFPYSPTGQVGGGKAHRRLMIPGRDGGSVVVGAGESPVRGEGTQRVSSGGTGMPGGRL